MPQLSGSKTPEGQSTLSMRPELDSHYGIREIDDDDGIREIDEPQFSAEDLLEKFQAKDEVIRELQTKVELLNAQLQSSDEAHVRELGFRDGALSEKEQRLREMGNMVEELQAQTQLLIQQHKATEEHTEANGQLNSTTEALQAELDQTRDQLKALASQIEVQDQTYRSSLNEKAAEVTMLTQRMAELEHQLSELITSQGQAADVMEMKLMAVEHQNATLQTENQRQRTQLCQLQRLHEEKVAELIRGKDDLAAAVHQGKSQLEQAQNEAQIVQSRCAELAKQLREKEMEVARLTGAAAKASEEAMKASDLLKKQALEIEGLTIQLSLKKVEPVLVQPQVQLSEVAPGSKEPKRVSVTSSPVEKLATPQQPTQAETFEKKAVTAVPIESVPVEDVRPSAGQHPSCRTQVEQMQKKCPNCVPLWVVREEGCTTLPLLEKKRLAVNPDVTLSKLREQIRSRLGLSMRQDLILRVDFDGDIPPTEVIGVLYQSCKDATGFLRLKFSGESP